MPSDHNQYQNPLITRYASREMSEIWSPQRKFSTWRRLWVALAESEAELGLNISAEQIAQLKAHVDDIDFEAADEHERRLRHDVMAHVHAYGDVCPDAAGIIHLGATSCFVTDNTDVLLLRDALIMVRDRVVSVLDCLAKFAAEYRDLPCLGFTHLQPAQPTTVGKRACLWAYDLVLDLTEIEHRLENLKARGPKGTTGTQASFLELFDPKSDPDDVIVDFIDSRVLDHSGLQAIDALAVKYEAAGKKLHLRHLSADCRRLLDKARKIVEVSVIEDPDYGVAVDYEGNYMVKNMAPKDR